jgi:hypothetical protein
MTVIYSSLTGERSTNRALTEMGGGGGDQHNKNCLISITDRLKFKILTAFNARRWAHLIMNSIRIVINASARSIQIN